jgi:hypothetical protein
VGLQPTKSVAVDVDISHDGANWVRVPNKFSFFEGTCKDINTCTDCFNIAGCTWYEKEEGGGRGRKEREEGGRRKEQISPTMVPTGSVGPTSLGRREGEGEGREKGGRREGEGREKGGRREGEGREKGGRREGEAREKGRRREGEGRAGGREKTTHPLSGATATRCQPAPSVLPLRTTLAPRTATTMSTITAPMLLTLP